MKWFYNLKIGSKLIIGFILVAIMAGIVGIVGVQSLRDIAERDKTLYYNQTVPIGEMGDLAIAFQRIRVAARDMIMATTLQELQRSQEQINQQKTIIDQKADSFEKTIVAADVRQTFQEFQQAKKNYYEELDVYIQLIKNNNQVGAKAHQDSRLLPATTKAGELIAKLGDLKDRNAKNLALQNAELASNASRDMLVMVGIAMIMAIGLGMILARIIGNPVRNLQDAANKIAQGNLDVNLKIDTNDEIGNLGQAFVKIIEALQNLVADSAMLAQAAGEGELSTRADANKHSGDYRKIVEGVNQTLEEIIEPINEVRMVLPCI